MKTMGNNGNGIFGWAAQMVEQNRKNLGDDADTQKMIQAIQSGNASQGEALANDILKKAGVSREQALQMAQQKFGLKF